jgi:hypothetical protein
MRLYTPPPLEGLQIHPVFYFLYPPKDKGGGLFRDVQQTFFKESYTSDTATADAIVLANNFYKEPDEKASAYIKQYADMGETLGKPVYIFASGDFVDSIRFDPHVFVFRYSMYKSSAGPKDISTPTVTEEPPQDLLFIQKKRERPLVAFCGQGGFKTTREWASFFIKTGLVLAQSLFRPIVRAHALGVYWRRLMMRACQHSPFLDTNFIVRSSFSGHKNTIELDPKKARREYLETSANADFVLAPKGDGNYSNRFLKTLAFGRIPVLVDTDVVLPLEEVIDYEKIIVRVPMDRVKETPKFIREFYDALTEEEWEARQHLARETFEKYLNQDSFFRKFFSQ